MYGAPDDHAWTDMSAAMKDAEKQKGRDGPDLSVSILDVIEKFTFWYRIVVLINIHTTACLWCRW